MNAEDVVKHIFPKKYYTIDFIHLKQWSGTRFSIGDFTFIASTNAHHLCLFGLYETFTIVEVEYNEHR